MSLYNWHWQDDRRKCGIYDTVRWQVYSPRPKNDVDQPSLGGVYHSARNLAQVKELYLNLFLANGTFEFIFTEILGTLPKTKAGNKLILVINDRFMKLAKGYPNIEKLCAACCFYLFWSLNPVLQDYGLFSHGLDSIWQLASNYF